MTFSIEVTRPDDLLRLRIDARNLRLDQSENEPTALVVDDAAQPALTLAGLLDWSALELSVSGIAAIGPNPTPAQIAAASAIAKPSGDDGLEA